MKTIVISSFVEWIAFGAVIGLSVIGILSITMWFIWSYWCYTNQYNKFEGKRR